MASSVGNSVAAIKWQDKREVLMLSTCCGSEMMNTCCSRSANGGVEKVDKPQILEDYNLSMGGVDKSELTPKHKHREG